MGRKKRAARAAEKKLKEARRAAEKTARRRKMLLLAALAGGGAAALAALNRGKPQPGQGKVTFRDEEPNGLSAMMGQLMEVYMQEPQKKAVADSMNVSIAIQDITAPDVATTITFKGSDISIANGVTPDAQIYIGTELGLLLSMSGAGQGLQMLKWLQTEEGKELVKAFREGRFKVKGALLRAPQQGVSLLQRPLVLREVVQVQAGQLAELQVHERPAHGWLSGQDRQVQQAGADAGQPPDDVRGAAQGQTVERHPLGGPALQLHGHLGSGAQHLRGHPSASLSLPDRFGVPRAAQQPRGRQQVERLEKVRLALRVGPEEHVQAVAQLHLLVGVVPEVPEPHDAGSRHRGGLVHGFRNQAIPPSEDLLFLLAPRPAVEKSPRLGESTTLRSGFRFDREPRDG